jgi:hypothetical protein
MRVCVWPAKYVYTVMCLCALAILATIIVLNLHDGSVENPPMWLRHFAYHLSRVLCMGTHGDPSVSVAPESEEVFADKLREHLVESKKNAKNGALYATYLYIYIKIESCSFFSAYNCVLHCRPWQAYKG